MNKTAQAGSSNPFAGTGVKPAAAGGAMDLATLLALMTGSNKEMTQYEKAQIDATNRGLDIRGAELGQKGANDAAGNQIAGRNADISAASQAATQAWYEAQAAIQRGDQALAASKQKEANYWNGVAQAFSSQAGARDEVQMATNAANSNETSRNNRAGNQVAAGNIYGNLASTVGNLAAQQQQLGLDILTKPRNAVAGFLMGIGNTPAAQAMGMNLDIKSILGIDPQSINQYLQMAAGAAQQAQAQANTPQQIDLSAFLNNLDARAKSLSGGGTSTGYASPNAPAQPGAGGSPPTNPGGSLLDRPGTPAWVKAGTESPAPAYGGGSTAPSYGRTPTGSMNVPPSLITSLFGPGGSGDDFFPSTAPSMMSPAQGGAGSGYQVGSQNGYQANGATYYGPNMTPPNSQPYSTAGYAPPAQAQASPSYPSPQGAPAEQQAWGQNLAQYLMQLATGGGGGAQWE